MTRREHLEQRIADFAMRQSFKWKDSDADIIEEAVRENIREYGVKWFHKLEKQIDVWHQQYVDNKHQPLGISFAEMEEVTSLPAPYLGYH